MENDVFLSEKSKKKYANIAIGIYFVVYIFYLFFFKINKDENFVLYTKPLIIPSIAFAYFFLTKLKSYALNIMLFLAIYFADNLLLLEDRSLYVFSTYLYIIAISILFYYVVSDSKIVEKVPFLNKIHPITLVIISIGVAFYKILNYIYDIPFKEIYVVLLYVLLFLTVLFVSVYNSIKFKSKASIYLLFAILCMFISDVSIVYNKYYENSQVLVYLSALIEVPVYYFLLKYLINREEDFTQ